MWSHSGIPIAMPIDDGVLRVFFGTRDVEGRTRPTFIDVRADDPADVLYVHDRPVLELGTLGAFDGDGVTPASIVRHEGRTFLYYIGWQKSVTVPYRLAIGLAVSDDNGLTFTRVFDGPVVDRTQTDPFFTTAPHVLKEDHQWRMWYVSCTNWLLVDGQPEPVYKIKYAESADGLEWERRDITSLEPRSLEEGLGRPCVLSEGVYRMWYCYRGSLDYRTDPRTAYRIGYAESGDGVRWDRKDDEVGIDRSDSGWDSVMQAYPYVYEHRGQKYMLYNGNGFGQSGIGYAVLEDE